MAVASNGLSEVNNPFLSRTSWSLGIGAPDYDRPVIREADQEPLGCSTWWASFKLPSTFKTQSQHASRVFAITAPWDTEALLGALELWTGASVILPSDIWWPSWETTDVSCATSLGFTDFLSFSVTPAEVVHHSGFSLMFTWAAPGKRGTQKRLSSFALIGRTYWTTSYLHVSSLCWRHQWWCLNSAFWSLCGPKLALSTLRDNAAQSDDEQRSCQKKGGRKASL